MIASRSPVASSRKKIQNAFEWLTLFRFFWQNPHAHREIRVLKRGSVVPFILCMHFHEAAAGHYAMLKKEVPENGSGARPQQFVFLWCGLLRNKQRVRSCGRWTFVSCIPSCFSAKYNTKGFAWKSLMKTLTGRWKIENARRKSRRVIDKCKYWFVQLLTRCTLRYAPLASNL